MSRVYYNDTDPFACKWLAELMSGGLIPSGKIDSRSIAEVEPDDLEGFDQCHFFAGIGGWALALRIAGWGDRPVWTGSCPCQPFSSAGKGLGEADERHLWPAFARLIEISKPPTVFGEQVAGKAGREWLSGVFADLEGMGYAAAGADLCAASVGAPHIRQRLWWVADRDSGGQCRSSADHGQTKQAATNGYPMDSVPSGRGGLRGRLADSESDGFAWQQASRPRLAGTAHCGWLGDGIIAGPQRHAWHGDNGEEPGRVYGDSDGSTAKTGRGSHWTDQVGLVKCVEPTKDGGTVSKYRRAPLEPSLFPLAHGVPNRVGTLRGAGNAIVPQVAAEFVRAYMEAAI